MAILYRRTLTPAECLKLWAPSSEIEAKRTQAAANVIGSSPGMQALGIKPRKTNELVTVIINEKALD